MGTPDFAVPSLKALQKNGYGISLVVTQPDRPKGRGRKVIPPPVKMAAQRIGYDIIQPVSVKDRDFFDTITGLKPDIFIVVAYGHILPKNILAIPATGAINLHASLLPRYRGSAPIQWAIINGEKETGVTTIFMDYGMDTGDILLSSKEKITEVDTSATLHDRLSVLGAELLIKTLISFESNMINPIAQDHAKATYAPLLKKDDGHILWGKDAEQNCSKLEFLPGEASAKSGLLYLKSFIFSRFEAKFRLDNTIFIGYSCFEYLKLVGTCCRISSSTLYCYGSSPI